MTYPARKSLRVSDLRRLDRPPYIVVGLADSRQLSNPLSIVNMCIRDLGTISLRLMDWTWQ
jgi:hypothetical protein